MFYPYGPISCRISLFSILTFKINFTNFATNCNIWRMKYSSIPKSLHPPNPSYH